MKMSYHQYSRCAPLKPDISYGVMGLSQISMNHAVKELLLKNMNHGRMMASWERTARCKEGRHGKLTLEQPAGREKNLMAQTKMDVRPEEPPCATLLLWRTELLFKVSEWDSCYYRRWSVLPLWLQLDTRIKSTVAYSEERHIWIMNGADVGV